MGTGVNKSKENLYAVVVPRDMAGGKFIRDVTNPQSKKTLKSPIINPSAFTSVQLGTVAVTGAVPSFTATISSEVCRGVSPSGRFPVEGQIKPFQGFYPVTIIFPALPITTIPQSTTESFAIATIESSSLSKEQLFTASDTLAAVISQSAATNRKTLRASETIAAAVKQKAVLTLKKANQFTASTSIAIATRETALSGTTRSVVSDTFAVATSEIARSTHFRVSETFAVALTEFVHEFTSTPPTTGIGGTGAPNMMIFNF